MENHHFFTLYYYAMISISIFSEFSIASDSINLNQSIRDGETLISSGQSFELGFFSPGSSQNRYLGIWHKSIPDIVVWVANKENPIKDSSGALTVSKIGGLILVNQTGSIIWSSSNSSSAAETETETLFAQLLDSGNLVLTDNNDTRSESYLWQSFNYPSNTWLPAGMTLGWNVETGEDQYLTSWKNTSDPSAGDFIYKVESDGLPQMIIRKGEIKKFRGGPWNGIQFSGFPSASSPIFSPIVVLNANNSYSLSETTKYSGTTRVTMNQSGLVQRYILPERSTEWELVYFVPYDQCDNYKQCGANGICRIYNTEICGCLIGFVPKLEPEWEILDWSGGCKRRTPLNCGDGEGFVKVGGVKLPDLLDFYWNKSMSLKECRVECMKNCSCTAYANSNITAGGSGCLMWFGDLIDIKDFLNKGTGQDIYIRLAASELESMRSPEKKKKMVIILVVSTISAMLILGLIYWCAICKKRTMRRGEDWELPSFDLDTIATATNNFSEANMLGGGGFGHVYKGNLYTGQVAVKRLSKSSQQGLEEFTNEVVSIAKLQHRNLVRLLGCCVQGEERMLIYEFMPNKSLDCFIFDENNSTLLSWPKRFDIVFGIARGLLYLHQDSRLKIIHRDLKASNILLDNNLNPKISDFGLARIFGGDEIYAKTNRVIGTYGYMSPEYAVDGTFSEKSDIFSFGVLMLEIVSGKRNRGFSHPDHHHNLLGHAWLSWKEDKALEIMDPCLKDSCVESQVLRCVQVGLLCVQKLPADRPTTSSVVLMLGNEGSILSRPKQPGFFIERSSRDTHTTTSSEEYHSKNAVTLTMLEAR